MRALPLVLVLACGGPSPRRDTADKPDDSGISDTDTESDVDTDADADADADTDTDTDTDRCAPLPAPSDVIEVDQADAIQPALDAASSGQTVRIADGTYDLSGQSLWIRTDGVILRGSSRDGTVLDGGYSGVSIVNVGASDVVITELTIQRAWYHPIHVTPFDGRDITGVRIHDVHLIDPGQQALKINTADNGTLFADAGELSCSHLELTDAGRTHIRDGCYTGGVDMHQGRDWVFRDNLVEGFWCPSGLSEHGIHLWRGGRDNLIMRNTLRDNARGIGLGLGSDGVGRVWADAPCGGAVAQDYGGVVQNNVVLASSAGLASSASGFDVGIALESACEATVVHNTVWSEFAPFSSIEWRFSATSGTVANNLVSHNLRDRGATVTLSSNVENVPASWFEGVPALSAAATGAIDQADLSWTVADDIDGLARDSAPDIGAAERR